MKTEETWVDKIHNELRKINEISYQIESLSNSFYHVGNEKVSNDLYEISKVLQHATKVIGNAVGESIMEGTKRAEESSKTMLMAALSGIRLGKEEPNHA